MSNVYMPFKSKILDVIKHTDIEYTFRMSFDGEVRPGQFFEVSIPKFGEAPISVSGIGEGFVDLTIRKVGVVTNEVFNNYKGDILFMRGPYGNGFNVDNYKGKELIIVAGGTGVSPVRGVINYFSENKDQAESTTVIAGFKSPNDLLFKDDLKKWDENLNFILTVDGAEEGYTGKVGLVTKYIKDIEIKDLENVQVIVVGPPMMMKFTTAEFLKRGIKEDNIWVSYERKMCCGIGKCGHCKIDDVYICVDGPVFKYSRAKFLRD